jgi:hypothetical protein
MLRRLIRRPTPPRVTKDQAERFKAVRRELAAAYTRKSDLLM